MHCKYIIQRLKFSIFVNSMENISGRLIFIICIGYFTLELTLFLLSRVSCKCLTNDDTRLCKEAERVGGGKRVILREFEADSHS